ncbi:MAG: hypothetical protein WA220_00380 [Candidatus Nitrosopolaris sp.]
MYDIPFFQIFPTDVDKVRGWFEQYKMESMELGINRRIALEVDVRCNVCETLARIPRYWNILRGLVVVSVALRQLKEQQKQ